MFVLITYDVNITSTHGAKRLRSVTVSGIIQFLNLKNKLLSVIDSNQDSIRFYVLGKNWKNRVETIGKDMGIDFTGELII